MTFIESQKYLKDIENSHFTPNHKNSVHLMTYLNNIQDTLPVIHVAGTNGKGSTISFLRDILIQAGYSVGTFMSPHIYTYQELIEDNTIQISEDDFGSATSIVKEACDKMLIDGLDHPTIFECLVGIAIVHFASTHHDYVIIEVGLGGKEDATNIFAQPLLSIITSIAYDHEAILGNTLEQISRHKAGIARKGSPLLLAPNPIEVISTVSEYVREIDGFMYLLDEGLIHSHTFVKTNTYKIFNLKSPFFNYRNLHTQMLGRHQELNLCTALLAVYTLKEKYKTIITDEAIYKGVKKTTWQCRNELLTVDPLILLDGAHNPAGALALSDLIATHYKDKRIITVFGVLKDKDYKAITKTISAFSDDLILTMPDSGRALNPSTMDLPLKGVSHHIEPSIVKALELALTLLDANTMLVITGSLYLTHPAKVWLTRHLDL